MSKNKQNWLKFSFALYRLVQKAEKNTFYCVLNPCLSDILNNEFSHYLLDLFL